MLMINDHGDNDYLTLTPLFTQLEEVMEEEKEKQWVLVHTSSTMRSQELADEEARLRSSGFDVTILRD